MTIKLWDSSELTLPFLLSLFTANYSLITVNYPSSPTKNNPAPSEPPPPLNQ